MSEKSAPAALHILPTDLRRWDESDAEALVLSFFADERPLRGAAGLADWRLCGKLSRLIKLGRIDGRRGETMMLPPGRRLRFSKLLVFGLGDSSGFDEAAYRRHVRWIRDVLAKAKVASCLLQPPGRALGLIAARRALELWQEEAAAAPGGLAVTLVEPAAVHKEMAEALRGKRG